MGDFNDFLRMSKLYEMDGHRMDIQPYNIENDIKDKLGLECMYMTGSNGQFNMFFNFFDVASFENARKIKKYFFDTIPHVISVSFEHMGFTVQLTRKFGLDVLNIKD